MTRALSIAALALAIATTAAVAHRDGLATLTLGATAAGVAAVAGASAADHATARRTAAAAIRRRRPAC